METRRFGVYCLGMARFFLHLHSDTALLDEEGIERPDLAAARAAAVRNIRDLLADDVMRGRIALRQRIDITDADGRVLATVPFREAVLVEG